MKRFALGVSMLVLVSCGAGPSAPSDPLSLIANFGDRARDAKTAHAEMTMRFSSPDADATSFTGTMRTQIDFERRLSAGVYEMPNFFGAESADAPDITVEVVTTEDHVYVKMPQGAGAFPGVDKPWMRMPNEMRDSDFGPLFGGGAYDPTKTLDMLRGVSDEIREAGTEEIDGVEATRYEVTVSVDKILERVPEEQRAQAESFRQMFSTMPMTVWLDGDGLLRRIKYSMNFGEGSMDMTMRMFDYGEPVTITVPPASQVHDMEGSFEREPATSG